MDENSNNLEGKLVASFEAKELAGLVTDYSELGLDSILDDGIVKDIPILRTLVGLAKIGFNVRDRIYIKKLMSFLAQVGQTTQGQREEFVNKSCNDVKRFEEAVMLILEQADNMEKPILIGKIFKACILGIITYENALVLSSMVNKSLWQDLQAMFADNYTDENRIRLANSCILDMSIRRVNTMPSSSTADTFRFTANSHAKMLIKIAKME